MAAATEPVTPRLLCLLIRGFYRFEVTSNAKVLVVPTQFRTECPMLLPNGIMPVFTTPVPCHLQILNT
jgi:hypothetical protein